MCYEENQEDMYDMHSTDRNLIHHTSISFVPSSGGKVRLMVDVAPQGEGLPSTFVAVTPSEHTLREMTKYLIARYPELAPIPPQAQLITLAPGEIVVVGSPRG